MPQQQQQQVSIVAEPASDSHGTTTATSSNGTNNKTTIKNDSSNQEQQATTNSISNSISNNKQQLTKTTISYNNNNKTTTQTAPTATTKQNGLKNRIIQRPPPLNLNEVSNLYHVNESPPNVAASAVVAAPSNVNSSNCNDQGQSNSANHKFWASLNRNAASRTQSNGAGSQRSETVAVATTKETATNALGPDLIITHRNSSTNSLSTNRTLSSSSTLSTHQNQHHNHHQHHHHLNHHHPKQIANKDQDEHDNNSHTRHESSIENKSYEQSNTSTEMLDDSSTHGGAPSESGGGNLIGVDQSCTPPVDSTGNGYNDSASANNRSGDAIDEYPNSASSNRPRSNNPFLAMDEESNPPSPVDATLKIFHKRPASFIAATGSAIMKRQAALLNSSFPNNSREAADSTTTVETASAATAAAVAVAPNTTTTITSQMLQDRFDAINLEDNTYTHPQQDHLQNQLYTNHNNTPIYQHSNAYDTRDMVHEIYGHHHRNSLNEPAISLDSESAVCQPPPSATLQLPYWTDAIYELNNAILETSSVAGGAENGKFIHIVENGDIILELDQIKVSGFTLSEFNELVESKPVHLLKAVQTKHSQGLTTDLRQYLNSSFPKGSHDKDLQDLIRENIYRRTIPCTTRPPKEGEVDKVDYHFLTREHFVQMNERGMLLECGMFNGHYYGTIKPYSDLNSLSIYGTVNRGVISDEMQQPLNPSHPAIGLPEPSTSAIVQRDVDSNNIYGTHGSYGAQQFLDQPHVSQVKSSSIVAVDSEALPHGWERVIDQTHGTYYIDHNTQRTQYERPYEIELTKGAMGFGFTLVEADNGMLLVRSIIPGGPAHMNGSLRPGDILVSAVGVSVNGLQHTDVARLFSTFAVGDRVRMTFARGSYVVDNNLVPDEYLFSNGTNGDLAVAFNPNTMNYFNHNMISQDSQNQANQEYEYITVCLKRGDQGFGFTISDSEVGQRVKKIQNNETCANLKHGDILINLNGQDITRLTHKQVVECLKNCPPGQDVSLVIKRKKRFRSKTPLVLPTESGVGYSLDHMQHRNCKTPSLDYLMMKRPAGSSRPASIISGQIPPQVPPRSTNSDAHNIYHSLPRSHSNAQPIYGTMQDIYYNQPQHVSMPSYDAYDAGRYDTMSNSVQASDIATTPMSIANVSSVNQMNQYNNFMNNDKFMMMQNHISPPTMSTVANHDYGYMPLYSNSEMLQSEPPMLPSRSLEPYYQPDPMCINQHSNYYANNEEIALQRLQCAQTNHHVMPFNHQDSIHYQSQQEIEDEYENHQIDLDKGSSDSNWGIRLIGGSEVGRAISIGSIVFGGAASKNGKLKSGDEIISINNINVIGATHQDVVELISGCTNRASLVVRRKKYAEACEVILTRNIDEGFGFVIISDENAALIGRIIKGSPADRCQQLHVRDQIVAVNGQQITPNMKHPDIVNMIKGCGSTLRLRVIPAHCYTVELIKSAQNDNFGFSMRGGNEYNASLYISKVALDGLARDLLNVGDQIIAINGIPTAGMTNAQAATIIKKSDPIVKLRLRHNEEIPPILLVDSPRALQQFNQVTAEVKAVDQAVAATSVTDSSGHLSDKSASFEQQHQPQHASTSQQQQTAGQHQVTNNHLVQSRGLPLYAT